MAVKKSPTATGKAAGKAAPAKKATAAQEAKTECSVYSVKKKCVVDVVDGANITKNPNGTFMLRGNDGDGDPVAGIIGKAKADLLLKKKLADKNF